MKNTQESLLSQLQGVRLPVGVGRLWVAALVAILVLVSCSDGDIQGADGALESLPFSLNGMEAPSLDDLVAWRLGPRPNGSIKTVVEHYLQQYQPDGKLPKLFETTRLYDRNGVLLAEFYEEGRRTWVMLDQISPALVSATVATEDASFFTNRGVDSRRIVGAALQNVQTQSIASGASTITMQLARNLFLDPSERFEQTVDRKLQEIGLAHDLTILFSKDELLEIYLNLVNYGHQAYGPEAAAQVYFGKSAVDLNWAEATILAGVPQQPAAYDLFNNFDAAKERQRVVLDLLVRHEMLAQEDADAVFEEEILLIGSSQKKDLLAPHFVFYVEKALEEQMAAALGIEVGRWEMRRSGMHIITTLDMPMQWLAELELQKWIDRVGEAYRMTNGALVAIQPQTGELLAMVGGVDFNEEDAGQVNLATSVRQPGSSFKPILYATALSEDMISPATVIWDTPTSFTVGMGHVLRAAQLRPQVSRSRHRPHSAGQQLQRTGREAAGYARQRTPSGQSQGVRHNELYQGAELVRIEHFAWGGRSLTAGTDQCLPHVRQPGTLFGTQVCAFHGGRSGPLPLDA